MTASWSSIDGRLENLVAAPVADDRSARDALSELMSTVAQINETAGAGVAPESVRGDLAEDLATRLKTWIDRLIDKLTEIVGKLAGAASFTITVGTAVSVSVTFGPFGT